MEPTEENKEKKKIDSKMITSHIAKAAVIAALYAALTVMIMPASYGVMQLRVSEALTVLPLFTPAAIPGLFVGCLVSNIVSPVGAIDMVVGSAATLIAAFLTYYLREHRLLALLPPVVTNGAMVGMMLYYCYNIGFPLPACMLWVGLGEAGAVYILGYPLSLFLDRHKEIFK